MFTHFLSKNKQDQVKQDETDLYKQGLNRLELKRESTVVKTNISDEVITVSCVQAQIYCIKGLRTLTRVICVTGQPHVMLVIFPERMVRTYRFSSILLCFFSKKEQNSLYPEHIN